MSRPTIPADIRRAILVEAGHRCAIPRCGSTELDIHHIVPWETCKRHDYDNLIALCPNCHRRADNGEIDRKSLRLYKSQLVEQFPQSDSNQFAAAIIEIKRCLSEKRESIPDFAPGYDFAFEFPDFQEPAARIVSRNIEAWGNELLLEYRERQKERDPSSEFSGLLYWLRGTYEVVRNDSRVISVGYNLVQMAPGAAHRNTQLYVQNFLVQPFRPLILDELLQAPEGLESLAELCRESLLSQREVQLDRAKVMAGTKPTSENFELFEIGKYAIGFIFREYQVGPYAIGPQHVAIPFDELEGIVASDVLSAISCDDDF